MNNNEDIYNFLKANGYKLIDEGISEYFGDYYNTFTNATLEIRVSCSKSFEMVDIRSCKPNEDWYDLALVKALLYNETNLNYITTIEEHKEYLKKELASIEKLFNSKNYITTREKLKKLGIKRAKQMFPGKI